MPLCSIEAAAGFDSFFGAPPGVLPGYGSPRSPQSSERLARHARARIPNDVRVREADYFDGSRAPESQGQKGSELATTENPKGEQTNLIAKRARASNLNHFVEILIKGIKAQARQMSTPATSNQMNENPTRHPKTENEKERQRKRKERGRRRAGARLAPAIGGLVVFPFPGFPWFRRRFYLVFPWFSLGFALVFLWFKNSRKPEKD